MALRKPESTPSFEDEEIGDTAVMEDNSVGRVAGDEPKHSPEQVAEAGVDTAKAIAKAATGAAVSSKFNGGGLKAYQDVIPLELRETMGFSAVPVITVDSGGGFWLNKNEQKLGDMIKAVLVSFNLRWVITPNESGDSDELSEAVRYSADGVTLEGTGESVADYLKMLRDVGGYSRAKKKAYIDLWVQLAQANGKDVHPEDREVYKVQLSPKSVDQFQGFQLSRGIKESQGHAKPLNLLVLTGHRKSGNGNDWGIIKFAAE